MVKTIYIGDIHGLTVWKDIVKKHSDADTIVFIGDYFDSFNVDGLSQLKNAQEIVDFKIKNKDKNIYLLLGNHDIHYYPDNKWDRNKTSGFQANMLLQFEDFFRKNKQHFQISCIVNENKLCSHAGVSDEFLSDNGFYLQKNCSYKDIPDFLNDLFYYKVWSMNFDSYRMRNQDQGYVDSYGDNIWQTPLWIRPKSLQKANKKSDLKKEVIQIVGHTLQKNIDIKGKTTGGRYYYIDTLPNNEYLVEIDNKFFVDKII